MSYPNGRELGKEVNQIPDCYYLQMDVDGDGQEEDAIALENRLMGDYLVSVVPEAEAYPEDTYSLEASAKEAVITLAKDVKIKDIPSSPYLISTPEKNWYLAEGCTAGGFESWVLVQNPNDQPAHVRLTFMTGEGPVPGPETDLAPNSRQSFNVGSYVTTYDVSTQVQSDNPVVVERAMYGGGRVWGHDSVGYGP